MPVPYLTPTDLDELTDIGSFAAASEVAIRALMRMRNDGCTVAQICGPLTTGGLGSFEANARRLTAAVRAAERNGLTTFDQMPFEGVIVRLKETTPLVNGYCYAILEEFYLPILASGHISTLLFLPDWQSSIGARWERETGARHGITIAEYPLEWLREVA